MLISQTQPSVRQDIGQSESSTKPLSAVVQPGHHLSTISIRPQPRLRLRQPSCCLVLEVKGQILNSASFRTSDSPLNLLMCVQNLPDSYRVVFVYFGWGCVTMIVWYSMSFQRHKNWRIKNKVADFYLYFHFMLKAVVQQE